MWRVCVCVKREGEGESGENSKEEDKGQRVQVNAVVLAYYVIYVMG